MSEHDPFNEPELAHPRARELMLETFFRDCTNEDAPFGSGEGTISASAKPYLLAAVTRQLHPLHL